MKIHVEVHRRAAAELRDEVDVLDLLALVVEVIAVDVEKRVERRVEPLARQNRRRHDPVLPVDQDLDAGPVVRRAVVGGEPVAVKLKRIDGRRRRAREAQRQARSRGGQREGSGHSHGPLQTGKTHGQ